MVGRDLLTEQARYYGERAAEYDRWFFRQGRYDRGFTANARWFAEIEQVREVLAGLPLDGADVVELAVGTGIWTEQLVRRAERVTAVDASPEMSELNRRRLDRWAERVDYVTADLFTWRPARRWDAVVFCFWLSHVPKPRLDQFLDGVAAMLHADGSIFFLDGRKEPTSSWMGGRSRHPPPLITNFPARAKRRRCGVSMTAGSSGS